MPHLSIPFTATRAQVAAYLLGVALFSVSFLVFLNSSISFVVTDRIGRRKNVGDAVGTLGFADELVALAACPLWGMVSDRVGVKAVVVTGYAIVGVSLGLLVLSRDVFPDLLLGRLLFSVGGSATATMVTAILPTMTIQMHPPPSSPEAGDGSRPVSRQANGHNMTPSISSEVTITPTRYLSSTSSRPEAPGEPDVATSTSQLAGLVGMFTGLGALLALLIFLPLPTRFQKRGASPAKSITYSFWTVGGVALVVALGCFLGLGNLPGEGSKGWRRLFGAEGEDDKRPEAGQVNKEQQSYLSSLRTSFVLGFQDVDIGLGYLGGFVARASSVAISLFIPLFVNAYFIRSGACDPSHTPASPGDIKQRCSQAYIVAAKLTGTSQLVALICAPLFGYLSGRYKGLNLPLLIAAFAGIAGYAAFGSLQSPDPSSEDGSSGVYFIVALLGVSQIGAIVCSLGQLGRGIQQGTTTSDEVQQTADADAVSSATNFANVPNVPASIQRALNGATVTESTSLLPSHIRQIVLHPQSSRAQLKGSIAGLYSLAGGVGILLLTKVGGLMFDRVDVGSPFWLMASFNGILFVATAACSLAELVKPRWDLWDGRTSQAELQADEIATGTSEDRSGDG